MRKIKKRLKHYKHNDAGLKQCPLCLRWFYSRAKRRKFCCTYHTTIWHSYVSLERQINAGKITPDHFRYQIYLRLKRYIEKERALVEQATANQLQAGGDQQQEGVITYAQQ